MFNNNNATIAETNAFYHVLFFKNRDCLFNSSKKWSGSILTKHAKKWLMIPWLEIPSLLQWGLITLCNAHHYRIQHISCIFVGGYLRHQDQVNLEYFFFSTACLYGLSDPCLLFCWFPFNVYLASPHTLSHLLWGPSPGSNYWTVI